MTTDAGRGRGRPIVIVGGGFAGAYCAQRLERLLGAAARRVLLIDRHNYFVFSPLLIEAGTGSLEPRHAVVSTRSFLRRARFIMGEVVSADTANRRVSYRPARRDQTLVLDYEHLVLAPGSVSSVPPIEGLAEHAFQMKSLADAVGLRDRAIQMLESADAEHDPVRRAAMLRLVVVGGSFTGVEVAGEFEVFLRQAARRYPNVEPGECRITLVELADRILPALDRDLADYAAQRLAARGVELIFNTSIVKVGPEAVELGDGRTIDAWTTIWCAGISPSPLIKLLDVPRDARGYVLTDPDLRVRGLANIWAIGDCASIAGPDGKPYPATAQHAVREGVAAADNIFALLRGGETRPFVYKTKGSLAPLGCRTAVAKIGSLKLSGLAAWVLWRTVYLMKMPGLARKLRVALDWTLDWVFPRDYVELGIHRVDAKRRTARQIPAEPGAAAALGTAPALPTALPEPPVPPPSPVSKASPFPPAPSPRRVGSPVVPFSQIAAQMAEAHEDEE